MMKSFKVCSCCHFLNNQRCSSLGVGRMSYLGGSEFPEIIDFYTDDGRFGNGVWKI